MNFVFRQTCERETNLAREIEKGRIGKRFKNGKLNLNSCTHYFFLL